MRPPSQRSGISSFIVMDVMQAAADRQAAGASVIHMEVGQPATPAPKPARAAVANALDRDNLGYTPALGTPALRERIARHYKDTYGVSISPGRVIVTTGSSGAFLLAFLALFDAGSRVGLPSPGYPCYRHILSALGVKTTIIETGPGTRWMPDAAGLAAVGPLDGLLIASPSNPTGTMLTGARLAEIAAHCRSQKTWFISDEIYHGLTYEAPAETALAYCRDAIVINSFSKYFSMTGWRVGWMVVPEGLVRTIERLAQNLFISPPAVAQLAALAAFEATEELEANRRTYAMNRELLLAELPAAGFDTLAPADGAFYIYADVSRLTADSRELTSQMLAQTGVAATPGIDFDEARGHRYVRFSYAGTTADMAQAARRLKDWTLLKGRG
jgi:aspartate/methionine/tyrosine aminotransferase